MDSTAFKRHLGVLLSLTLLGAAQMAQAGEAIYLRTGTIKTAGWSRFNATQKISTREAVVQFKQAATEADKLSVKDMGFKILRYLPEDAFVVSGEAANRLNSLPQVRAVMPYSAAFKVSPDFGAMSVFSAQQTEKVLVKTFSQADTDAVAQAMYSMPGQVDVKLADGKVIIVEMSQAQIAELADLDGVEHIQPYVEMKTFDPADIADGTEAKAAGDYSDITGFEDGTAVMNFSAAWKKGLTGKGQSVAMADTGLDSGNISTLHADLQGAVTSGYAYGIFADSWNDPMGHGTHVAGSVLSRGTNSSGKIRGGAYEATMVAQGMWSPVMDNLTVPPKLETMFKQAYTDGARVHTNSWGAARNFGAYDSFANQVDEFMFKNPDFLLIFAAGNSGVDKDKDGRIDEGSVSSPGTAKNCLTVGASENLLSKGGIQAQIKQLRSAVDTWPADPISSDYMSNNVNGLAMFSSRGPALDGRYKPDVVAPGTNILSLKSQVKDASDLWGAYNQFYAYSGGTSMSTPLVAGSAAVVRQLLALKGEAAPSAALVKGWLIHSAVDMYPGQFGEVGKAKGQELLTRRPTVDAGFGRVDMNGVANNQIVFIDNKDGVGQGLAVTVNVKTKAPGKLVATLVYTDAPASSGAAKALVNDLDLEVKKADGTVVTKNDHINNVEMVELDQAAAGQYVVTIKGFKIPQGVNGKQPYAILVSGEGVEIQ